MNIDRLKTTHVIRYLALWCVSLCFVAALVGCMQRQRKEVKSESIADIQRREGVPVRVTAAGRGTIDVIETAGGTAEGCFQTTLTAGMPGTITAVNVTIGDAVAADSSLMRIDPSTPQTYALAKEQFDNAAKSRERLATLAKEGAVSQEIIDQVDAGYNAAREGLNVIRKSQFVIAPFSGTVIDIIESVNSNVHPGSELIVLANIDKIRVPVIVSDLLINKFKKGQKAYALVAGDTVEGKIDRVPLAGQASTHTFTIDAMFSNPRRIIKPGMYLPIRVVIDEKRDVVTLPLDAVIIEGDRPSAFVVDNGTAHKRSLTTGVRSGDLFEIIDGIAEGAKVVVSGASLLSDGVKVKIVP